MGLVDILPLRLEIRGENSRDARQNSNYRCPTTHDYGPSLARAIDRSCQTARVFTSFGASTPIRSDAPRTLCFWVALKDGRSSAARPSIAPIRSPSTHGKRNHDGSARADASLACEGTGPSQARRAPKSRSRRRASHSLNCQDSGFLRRGALRVMLDKAGGDMVPLRLNLRPPKEKEVSGISIQRLL